MHRVILLIGGNEGDRTKNMDLARALVSERMGSIVQSSGSYESEPWGFCHQQNFVNQVIELQTNLTPEEILETGKAIERLLGRKPKTKTGYEGRTMDIDILFFDNMVFNSEELTIPHPKLHERRFTLLPLAERWEGLIHPQLNKTVKALLADCKDTGWVKLV